MTSSSAFRRALLFHRAFQPTFSPSRYHVANAAYLSTSGRRFQSSFAQGAYNSRDYYEVLGVPRNASSKDIKQRYYRLAKEHHPDKNSSSDASKFAEINTAYEVLSDDRKRRLYDTYGHAGVEAAASDDASGSATSGFSSAEEVLREYTDLFSSMGMRMRNRQSPDASKPGAAREMTVSLSFNDVVHGVERSVEVHALRQCSSCSGSGKTSATTISHCPHCHGRGSVSLNHGVFQTIITECSHCSGSGRAMKDPCGDCAGRGVTPGAKETTVAFPAGVDDGMVLRVPGGGDDGVRNGPPGDLFVKVRVSPHKYYRRKGRDLYVHADVDFATAALGGNVKVNTVDGEQVLRIRPGTQNDTTITLTGRGLAGIHGQGGRGDQFVSVRVAVPERVDGRRRELLEELRRLDEIEQQREEENKENVE